MCRLAAVKGFFWGACTVLAALWLFGVIHISWTPLSVNNNSGSTVGEPTAAPPSIAARHEPLPADLVRFRGDGFSVSLPGKPERATTSDAGHERVFYAVRVADRYMGIGHVQVPHDKAPDVILRTSIRDGAATSGASVHDEAATTYQGFPARDARYTDVDGCCTVFIRMIITRSRFYQLEYLVTGTDRATPAVFKKFISSLRIG
ncbi:MAG: hypothetical protein QOJ46_983 [bacterium]